MWAYDGAGRLPAERRRRFAVASTAASLYRARLSGDVTEALSAAREVLGEHWDRRLAPDVRALTLANLGIAEFWGGSLAQAGERLQQAAGLALECGNDFVLFMAESYAAAADAREGRLAEAARRARTAIQLAERRGWTGHAHAAIAYATLGTVQLWRDEPRRGRALRGPRRGDAGAFGGAAAGRGRGAAAGPPAASCGASRWRALDVLRERRRGPAAAALPAASAPPCSRRTLWLVLGEPGRARARLRGAARRGHARRR